MTPDPHKPGVVLRLASPEEIDSATPSETSATPVSVDESSATPVFVDESGATPVFVDESGRRQRLMGWLAAAVGTGCVAYTALLGISFAGGPVNPQELPPFPNLTSRPLPVSPTPDSTPHRVIGRKTPAGTGSAALIETSPRGAVDR